MSQLNKQLKKEGLIDDFRHMEMSKMLVELYTLQGKSERIKNFPYPRQFATLNHFFMWIFVLLLPLSIVPQFAEIGANVIDKSPLIGKYFMWFSIPFYVIVAWIFHTMERIGRTGENPFEGTSNDVPISTIARGIEIDLREMLDENEADIPKHYEQKLEVQM